MIDWNNLQKILNEHGKKMSRVTGISTGNISDWFNLDKKAHPSAEALVKMADMFECSVDYLLGRTNVKEVNYKTIIQPTIIYCLPVYNQNVAAGFGQFGFDQKHHMENFNEIDMPQKVSYGIKISGTSIVTDDENSIPDGSTILVTTDFDYDDLIGEAVVINIGGVLVCKEYNIAEDGHLWLKSRNPQKSNEDRHIYDIDSVKIIEKVVKAIY